MKIKEINIKLEDGELDVDYITTNKAMNQVDADRYTEKIFDLVRLIEEEQGNE